MYAVGRVAQGMRREMQLRLAEYDLSVPEFTALSVLLRRPGLSNAQLARRSVVTPQSMSLVVAGLERRGLLVRTVDSDHNKILRAEVTASGKRLLRKATPAITQLEEDLFRHTSPGDREIVLEALLDCMQTLSLSRREADNAQRNGNRRRS